MSVVKDKNGTYCVKYYKKDKRTGKLVSSTKRGFKTKRDANAYDANSKINRKTTEDVSNMPIEEVAKGYFIYNEDLKEKSLYNKKRIVNLHILNINNEENIASFRGMKLSDINEEALKLWQNAKMKEKRSKTGKGYSKSYLRTMRKELSAILNYAEKVLKWEGNPSKYVPRMGESSSREMDFWTLEQFKQFISVIDKDSMYYVIFMLLYYTGMRIGELLALTFEDINESKKEITINKTIHRYNGKDVVTSPKTTSSIRNITVSEKMMDELHNYMQSIYGAKKDTRLFPIVDRTVAKQLDKYIKIAGVPHIHIHCLRHSHVALLIDMKEDMYIISKRLGHSDIKITMNKYGHLYPNADKDLASRLNELI